MRDNSSLAFTRDNLRRPPLFFDKLLLSFLYCFFFLGGEGGRSRWAKSQSWPCVVHTSVTCVIKFRLDCLRCNTSNDWYTMKNTFTIKELQSGWEASVHH